MKKKTSPGLKIICLNRKASFNYFFEDLIEAGIVLKGSEIKSVREGKVNIADSYAVEKNGEIVLINSHIAQYKQASMTNHNPMDERKLLLIEESGRMQEELTQAISAIKQVVKINKKVFSIEGKGDLYNRQFTHFEFELVLDLSK